MTGDEMIAEVRRLLANGAGARDETLYICCLEMARELQRAGNRIDESVVRCIVVSQWRRDRSEPRAWAAIDELAAQVERLRALVAAGDVGHEAARDATNMAAKALADWMPSGRHGKKWWSGSRASSHANGIAFVKAAADRWWWRAGGKRGVEPTEMAAKAAALAVLDDGEAP